MAKFNSEKTLFKDLLEFSKQSALVNLLESGIDSNFIVPMLDKLRSNVINGSNITDIVDELKLFIIGSREISGSLERYVKQVSHDSLIQFSRTYEQTVTKELGLEFYRYVGTLIRDSRPFCQEFINKYFHKKEVEDMGRGINPLTGASLTQAQRQGRISGTNESNIFINAGGWQCRHSFTAINTQFVPKKVLIRNIEKGYFNPTPAQKDALGLSE